MDFTPGDQDAIAAYATALRVSPEGYIRRTAAERVLSAAFRTVGIDPREVFGPFVHEQSTAIHQWCYNEVKIVSGGIVLPVMPSRDRPSRTRHQVSELEGGVIHRAAADQMLEVVFLDEAVDDAHGRGPAFQDGEFVVGQQPLIVGEDLELAAARAVLLGEESHGGGDEPVEAVTAQCSRPFGGQVSRANCRPTPLLTMSWPRALHRSSSRRLTCVAATK